MKYKNRKTKNNLVQIIEELFNSVSMVMHKLFEIVTKDFSITLIALILSTLAGTLSLVTELIGDKGKISLRQLVGDKNLLFPLLFIVVLMILISSFPFLMRKLHKPVPKEVKLKNELVKIFKNAIDNSELNPRSLNQ